MVAPPILYLAMHSWVVHSGVNEISLLHLASYEVALHQLPVEMLALEWHHKWDSDFGHIHSLCHQSDPSSLFEATENMDKTSGSEKDTDSG